MCKPHQRQPLDYTSRNKSLKAWAPPLIRPIKLKACHSKAEPQILQFFHNGSNYFARTLQNSQTVAIRKEADKDRSYELSRVNLVHGILHPLPVDWAISPEGRERASTAAQTFNMRPTGKSLWLCLDGKTFVDTPLTSITQTQQQQLCVSWRAGY